MPPTIKLKIGPEAAIAAICDEVADAASGFTHIWKSVEPNPKKYATVACTASCGLTLNANAATKRSVGRVAIEMFRSRANLVVVGESIRAVVVTVPWMLAVAIVESK